MINVCSWAQTRKTILLLQVKIIQIHLSVCTGTNEMRMSWNGMVSREFIHIQMQHKNVARPRKHNNIGPGDAWSMYILYSDT